MGKSKQKDKKKRQKQKAQRRIRSLHDKHRRRRKKDLVPNIPFIVAYQGDPAMGAYYFCNDVHDYKLIGSTLKPFERLKRYQMKGIASLFKLDGKILVKEAGRPKRDGSGKGRRANRGRGGCSKTRRRGRGKR